MSDGDDASTVELVRQIARSMEFVACLIPIPPLLLRFAGAVAGRSADVARLLGDFVVDSTKIRTPLKWRPPFTLDQGLARSIAGLAVESHR